ncbi:hypothetical protein CRU94_05670 [Arcobacter sp. AHV-9/2010]|uniref:hypothetical protein n=1 Tax=Arcobacter sp. AHV-9/2010 TaxID=2021861 RepID=UPI00100A55F3|nr:hypothetical protein [Arcobacter sp. CECT 9299]RXJ95224.1 hypothetical protein CRU94_05670 [Arcobacter sp. CECT 9299]
MLNLFKENRSSLTFKIVILLGLGFIYPILANSTKDSFVEVFSNISENSNYYTKIVSKKEIKDKKSTINYVVITGDISSKNNILDRFSISLDERYITSLSDLSIKIENLKTKRIYSCEATFLDKVSPAYSYHIQVDISNKSANCYLKSKNKLNSSTKLDSKGLNKIDDKSIKIKDKSLIDEKELKKFKKIENPNKE